MVATKPLHWLDPHNPETPFPPVEFALHEPNGLLAVGGDLSRSRLLKAYRQGIFPWYNPDQPILWWSPDPRTVLYPEKVHISRSLRKTLRQAAFRITLDHAFREVITACAQTRDDGHGTWISPEMIEAYCVLFAAGDAHSVEVWQDGLLVGGLYGLAIGRIFFGESMFSRRSNASKVALVRLAGQLEQWGYRLIDCQIESAHLHSLGATAIPRKEFITLLNQWCAIPGQASPWQLES